MIETNKLRKLIKDSGLKYSFIAKKMNITAYSLQKKIYNKNEFKGKEIAKICDILNIEDLTLKEEIFYK